MLCLFDWRNPALLEYRLCFSWCFSARRGETVSMIAQTLEDGRLQPINLCEYRDDGD